MTADQIRKADIDTKAQYSFDTASTFAIFEMLREIAAQLAELRQTIDLMRAPETEIANGLDSIAGAIRAAGGL